MAVTIGETVVQAKPYFRLYLTTSKRRPEYPDSFLEKVRPVPFFAKIVATHVLQIVVIDCTLGPDDVEARLFDIVMATRNSTLYDDILRQDAQLVQTREQLAETEQNLLQLVGETAVETVDDAFLRSCRELQDNIGSMQRELLSAEKRRTTLLGLTQRLHLVSNHATWLHQTLTDLRLVLLLRYLFFLLTFLPSYRRPTPLVDVVLFVVENSTSYGKGR